MKAAKQLEALAAAKEEAERCKGAVRLLNAEVRQLREVRERLRDSEKARHLLTAKLLEASAEAQSSVALQRRAAVPEVNLADAKDLIAAMKARVGEQEAALRGRAPRN